MAALTYNPASGSYEPDHPSGYDWVTYRRAVILFQRLADHDALEAERAGDEERDAAMAEAERSADDAQSLLCDFLRDALAVGLTGCMKEVWEA